MEVEVGNCVGLKGIECSDPWEYCYWYSVPLESQIYNYNSKRSRPSASQLVDESRTLFPDETRLIK